MIYEGGIPRKARMLLRGVPSKAYLSFVEYSDHSNCRAKSNLQGVIMCPQRGRIKSIYTTCLARDILTLGGDIYEQMFSTICTRNIFHQFYCLYALHSYTVSIRWEGGRELIFISSPSSSE